ncbi:TPA: efflux RND transporter periplasmic adaptor subunit [Streptococcus equi subsp. zooepidemicus]|nr:efflux RND transporter periplasmic adaptor subunit [Streptococcus equi subsp. zooepidemicus]
MLAYKGRKLKGYGKKRLVIGLSVTGLALLAGGYYWYSQSQTWTGANEVVEALPVKEAIANSQKVTGILSGEVEPNHASKVKIDSSKGAVKEIFVKAGDTVTEGQALFSYDTAQALTAQSASYDVQSRAGTAQTARSNADIKWGTYHQKVADLGALQARYNQGGEDKPSQEDLRTAQSAVNQALEEAQTGENEAKNAQIDYEKAVATSNTENERLKYDTVIADAAGLVTSVNTDLKNQSADKKEKETFMEIVDRSKYFINGEVNEVDRDKIQLGQRVTVIDRKNYSKTWLGTVTQVGDLTTDSESGTDGKENPNLSKYPYKVELDQTDTPPVVGSHTYVKLLDSSTEAGKFILNKSYLVREKGKTFVWKVTGKKIVKQDVKVNKVTEDLYELVEGLTQEDRLALPKTGMTDGMEVGQDVKTQ